MHLRNVGAGLFLGRTSTGQVLPLHLSISCLGISCSGQLMCFAWTLVNIFYRSSYSSSNSL